MPQSVVWTISTSVLALRETSDGTDPSSRPATLLSPTLPTTSRSAWTSSARCTSALMGAPTIGFSSTFVAPALCARHAIAAYLASIHRPAASQLIGSVEADPRTHTPMFVGLVIAAVIMLGLVPAVGWGRRRRRQLIDPGSAHSVDRPSSASGNLELDIPGL